MTNLIAVRTLLVLCFCLASVAEGANRQVQRPALNTGTGAHDFYNLVAYVGTSPATYGVAVASNKKVSLDDVAATLPSGAVLTIRSKETLRGPLGLVKSEFFEILLSREQVDEAAKNGTEVRVSSRRGGLSFKIPKEEFVALAQSADSSDIYRGFLLSLANEDLRPYKQLGTSKIVGQAFLKTQGGDVKLAAGNPVVLVPALQWLVRIAESADLSQSADWPEDLRNTFLSVARSGDADAGGNFEFGDLPGGDYLLATKITWSVPGQYGLETTGGLVTRIVSVEAGSTKKVMLTR
jgi:hypothetical protein